MGVEPTFEQEAARTTVLKTVQTVFQRAPGQPRLRLASTKSVSPCARLPHVYPGVSTVLQQILQ